ncbi:MAG: hypothetical protein IT431_02520 [Phycisphaerales bacterium]|nr:hypothetical protein [Phycisphaerales bacterium]
MLTLDQLASDWLAPRAEADFSLPAITNFRGAVQAAWGVSGIQNWICPPTGMATPTATLFLEDAGRIRRFPRAVEYRWRAYQIERRGGGVESILRMPAGLPGVMERLRFNRAMKVHIVFGGLARVWRFTDYWNLPPEDVPMLNARLSGGGFLLEDTKTFGRAEFVVPGRRAVYDDLQAWLDGEPPVERGRVGVATLEVEAGDEVTWYGLQGCEPCEPFDPDEGWESGRRAWETVWEAAFTPGNRVFTGHLPAVRGDLERLYDMSVLTLLMTRRMLPALPERAGVATGGQCIWNEEPRPVALAYVIGGPEGAPTTSFLWELMFQAPMLARLDPGVLRAQMEAFMRVDLHQHWGVETVSGRGAGMGYGVNAGAFLSCVSDYVRLTGDREWALRHLAYLRTCARPELTDYGHSQHILECVSTYEHTIASFNALNVAGLRTLAELTGEAHYAEAADRLAARVIDLYAGGPFACLLPDGSRRVVRTILDFVYVGRSLEQDLSEPVKTGMLAFFREELRTDDWLYALSPRDGNALTPDLPSFQTYRADHQATGAYDGWPALAASVLARFGRCDEALGWLRRLERLTHEGPFGQAHFIHPDGCRKASFFNGNMYLEPAGCAFATVLLEDFGWAGRALPGGPRP